MTGMDGNPAPVPTSIRLAPCGSSIAFNSSRLSTKCLYTISRGSVMAVRFIF